MPRRGLPTLRGSPRGSEGLRLPVEAGRWRGPRLLPPAWVSSCRTPPGLSPGVLALFRSPGRGRRRPALTAGLGPLPSGDTCSGPWRRRGDGACLRHGSGCDLSHPQTPKGGPSFGPSNPTLVPLCRTAWQGCGRNYRAALCTED